MQGETTLSVSVILYLILTLGLGLWASRYVKTLADFILAGRNLPLWLVMPTTFALWFGAETVMGASHATATQGIGWDVLVDPVGAAICLVLYGLFFARPLYRTGNLTMMDFYGDRYGAPSGMLSALINAPGYLFWVGGQLFAFGIVLDHLFGIGFYFATILGALVIVIYTFRGGLMAITVTEFVEMLLIVSCLVVVWFAMNAEVGLGSAYEVWAGDGLANPLASIDPEQSMTGNRILGLFEFLALLMAVGAGSLPSQDLYERANSSRSEDVGSWSMVGGGFMYLAIGLVPISLGIMAYSHFGAEAVAEMEEGMVLNLVDLFGSGFVRVAFYAALISALLSTASAAILAPSVLIGINVIRPMRPSWDDDKMLRVTRLTVLGFSFLALLLALTKVGIHDLVEIASTLALVSLVVPLTAGLYWKRGTAAGAIMSMIIGLSVYVAFSALSLWQGAPGNYGFTEDAGYAWLVDVSFSGQGWLFPTSVIGFTASLLSMVGFSYAPERVQRSICARAERAYAWATGNAPGRSEGAA